MLTDIVTISAPTVQAFLLALLRVGGFIASAPALSRRSVPVSVRIDLSLAIRLGLRRLLAPTLPQLAVVSINELVPDLEVFALHQIGVTRAD